MAIVGFSKPKFARYKAVGSSVTYSGGGSAGRGISANLEIESAEDNNLYADNSVAETDRQFTGGTLTVGTDDLSQLVSAAILGLKFQALEEIPGVLDQEVQELVFDEDQQMPYLGYGFIRKHIVRGVTKWEGVVLTKIMFSVPSESATTQGDTIEWQTPELTATVMRDDSPKHKWKRAAMFTTEAQAEAYLDYVLNIPSEAAGVGDLTVTSTAASEQGKTIITVDPALLDLQHYMYKTDAEAITLPETFGEKLSGWMPWDGVSPITAATGQYIAVATANEDDQVIAAGQTTVQAGAGA